MSSEDILNILRRLENYRLRLEAGEANPGTTDHTVRLCQAFVADNYFSNRATWIQLLEEEK